MSAKKHDNDDRISKTVEVGKGKTVVIAELGGLDSLTADRYASKFGIDVDSDNISYKAYAICSVTHFNGEAVVPLANEVEFSDLLRKFRVPELARLVRAYVELSGEVAKATDPKSSSETAPSDS